jgi:DNA (cytosine-5)-methyltransferase 1
MRAAEGCICETVPVRALQELDANREVGALCLLDFFSGCGGTSAGFRAAGARVLAGIDNDRSSGLTFARNFPEALFIGDDIQSVTPADLDAVVAKAGNSPLVFTACAPCQPFSKQRRGPRINDAKAPLLRELLRFVQHFMPECIFIENVPGMQRGLNSEFPLQDLQSKIAELGYFMTIKIISCAAYGVPQRRTRLVALASRLGEVDIPAPTHGPGKATPNYSTVKEWIGDLPPLKAGEKHPVVPNHRAAGLSDLNLRRIRATPEGGGRSDWPVDLLPQCHSGGYEGHTDVYGRMAWDAPASGLTTRCISYSNGRFGHPDQDRAISIREAACLQTFPRDFIFEGNWESMGRQIGNAVPVQLAEIFATHIIEHIVKAG